VCVLSRGRCIKKFRAPLQVSGCLTFHPRRIVFPILQNKPRHCAASSRQPCVQVRVRPDTCPPQEALLRASSSASTRSNESSTAGNDITAGRPESGTFGIRNVADTPFIRLSPRRVQEALRSHVQPREPPEYPRKHAVFGTRDLVSVRGRYPAPAVRFYRAADSF
jgi:hypothetical protein